ncbi:DUF4232 domain-containing protein [Streptomyces nodosus]|uniref:DUF4232 domain-containing protein n=1 Tax=Streptomyces nodosus TaxID=40318 RepID=UPI00380F4AF1
MRVPRLRTVPAFVAVLLAAGIPLTACKGSGDEKGRGGRPVRSVQASPGASVTGTLAASGTGSTAGRSPAAPRSRPPVSPPRPGSTPARPSVLVNPGPSCKTMNLTFAKGATHTQDDFTAVVIKLTNSGSTICSLRGYPSVDLVGKDGRVSAQRTMDNPQTVTLAPGRSATFDLLALRNDSGGTGATFSSAVIVPPNETHRGTLQLTVHLPVLEDGSTDEAVFVGPVRQ